MPLSTGDKPGPYEILSAIGAGGMGEVYKARDTRREARMVAALNHRNICQLYDVGPNYLVMEFIEGVPLQGPIPPAKARLVADAATLHSKRPDLKIELLCDGAPEMWNLLEEGFIPKFGNDLYRLVDLHHFMEKLGAAARVIDDSPAAGERLRRWKMSLLNRASAATGILGELTASGMDEGVGTDHPVHAAIKARLAIRYVLANPTVTAPIPGLANIGQVDNLAAAVMERRKLPAWTRRITG